MFFNTANRGNAAYILYNGVLDNRSLEHFLSPFVDSVQLFYCDLLFH